MTVCFIKEYAWHKIFLLLLHHMSNQFWCFHLVCDDLSLLTCSGNPYKVYFLIHATEELSFCSNFCLVFNNDSHTASNAAFSCHCLSLSLYIIRCHVLPSYLTGSLFPLFIILYLCFFASNSCFLCPLKEKNIVSKLQLPMTMPTLSILFRIISSGIGFQLLKLSPFNFMMTAC